METIPENVQLSSASENDVNVHDNDYKENGSSVILIEEDDDESLLNTSIDTPIDTFELAVVCFSSSLSLSLIKN